MRKLFFKALPFFLSIIIGIFLYKSSNRFLNSDFRSLVINISASFLSIPLIYLFYEIVKSYSHKKLTQTYYFYTKEQVDGIIITIIGHLIGITHDENSLSYVNQKKDKALWIFLHTNREELKLNILNNKHLGFFIYKKYDTYLEKLDEIINNTLLIKEMDDDQVISILEIRKGLQFLKIFEEENDIFKDTGTRVKSDEYKFVDTNNVSLQDTTTSNSVTLYKKYDVDSAMCLGSAVFLKRNINKCPLYFTINEVFANRFVDEIMSLNKNILSWLKLTNNEFILDPVQFGIAINDNQF